VLSVPAGIAKETRFRVGAGISNTPPTSLQRADLAHAGAGDLAVTRGVDRWATLPARSGALPGPGEMVVGRGKQVG
jgi:hypothetical protein